MKAWARAGTAAILTTVVMATSAMSATAGGGATRGYLVNVRDGSLNVLDPGTNSITERILLGGVSADISVRPDGREVYLPDPGGARVLVLSTITNRVVATVPVGGRPDGIAFTPDSRRAYVSDTGNGSASVTAIDTTARQVLKVIPVGGEQTSPPAVAPDGSRVYVGTERAVGNSLQRDITAISTAVNQVTKVIPLPRLMPASQIVFAHDSSVALINTGAVLDARTDTVLREIALGLVTDFEFAPDSATVYLANPCTNEVGAVRVVSVSSGAVVRTLFTGRNPASVSLTPDNSRLYAVLDGWRNVAELDITTGAVLDQFGVTDPARAVNVDDVHLSGTAPPATGAGTRFPLAAPDPNVCLI